MVAKGEDLLDGLVGGADLGLAGGAARPVLTDGLPSDGAPTPYDEEATHGPILEELNFLAIWDGAADMAAPVRVTEALNLCAGRRRAGVGVGLAIVGRWVVEIGWRGRGCRGVVCDSLANRRAEILDDVESRLQMLRSRTAAVGGQERHRSGEVGAGVCGKPGEAADKGLVRLAAAHKRRVLLVNRRRLNGVDGAPGAVWCSERVEGDVRKPVSFEDVLGVRLL